MEELYFNNMAFSDFGVFYDGSQAFMKPERDVTFIEVAGRNGDLSFDNGRFRNVDIPFKCFIREGFKQNYAELVNYLSYFEGYGMLEYSQEPDIFRQGQFVSMTEPETGAYNEYATFTITFNCKPQKWYYDGSIMTRYASGAILENPSYMTAKPLIYVNSPNNTAHSLTLNGYTVTVAKAGEMYIDCELMDAYDMAGNNMNAYVTANGGFPILETGDNVLTHSGFNSVSVMPRWWRL